MCWAVFRFVVYRGVILSLVGAMVQVARVMCRYVDVEMWRCAGRECEKETRIFKEGEAELK